MCAAQSSAAAEGPSPQELLSFCEELPIFEDQRKALAVINEVCVNGLTGDPCAEAVQQCIEAGVSLTTLISVGNSIGRQLQALRTRVEALCEEHLSRMEYIKTLDMIYEQLGAIPQDE